MNYSTLHCMSIFRTLLFSPVKTKNIYMYLTAIKESFLQTIKTRVSSSYDIVDYKALKYLWNVDNTAVCKQTVNNCMKAYK